MLIEIIVVAGLDACRQREGHSYSKKCFLHVNFLLRFTHGDGMCAEKLSRKRGR
jgi:hypothetical protein